VSSALTDETRRARIEPPAEGDAVSFILDTDTKNEIDDQFAVVYALSSPKLHCEALYAAPFTKKEYPTAREGMLASYDEAVRVVDMLGLGTPPPILKGSETFLTGAEAAPVSPAALDLIARCKREEVVRVVAIGALTNIAAAIKLEPSIVERLVVLWLGGHPDYWHTNREFNLIGDLEAAQIVLNSGVPLVRFPCKNVAELIASSPVEIEQHVAPCGEIGAYLSRIFAEFIPGRLRSKPIWDLAPLAWLVNPKWVPTRLGPTPRLNDDLTWDHGDVTRPIHRVAVDARRDPILLDFVTTLESFCSAGQLLSV